MLKTERLARGDINMTTIDEHRSHGQIIADLTIAHVQRLPIAFLYVLQVHLRLYLVLIRTRTTPNKQTCYEQCVRTKKKRTCMNNAGIYTVQSSCYGCDHPCETRPHGATRCRIDTPENFRMHPEGP